MRRITPVSSTGATGQAPTDADVFELAADERRLTQTFYSADLAE